MIVNVTYDLKKPGQDYKDLIDELKKLGAWWHHLESTWLIDTSYTPDQIWEKMKPYLDQNDNALIFELKKGSARQGWLPKDAWDWINERL